MSDAALQPLTHTLHTIYSRIYRERMSDMPMVNSAIQVHTIGFQHWQGHIIGILITPWCMNLMCLPGDNEDWSGYQDLTKMNREFPAGTYEFINSSDKTIGKYQMCSLFSPMFEFPSDSVAVETAHIILRELMNPEHNHAQLKATPLHSTQTEQELPDAELPESAVSDRLQQPVNRRQLLRGAFQLDRTDK